MTAYPLHETALLRVKRRNYFVCAAAFLFGLLLHCLITRSVPMLLVFGQLAWATSFIVLGQLVGSGWMAPRVTGVLAGLAGLLSVTFFVHLTGGPTSPYFLVLAALPFLMAMFTPDSRLPTAVAGAGTLLSVCALNVLAGVPPITVQLQGMSMVLLVALALFGTRTYRRMGEAQRSGHQDRLLMLERLADSERLRSRAERERAEVDRLVLVGQLAAGVAHEVNNPLAYVKANLSYLAHELRADDTRLDREELRGVISETQQGVLRIQQIVTDLRGFSRAGGGGGGGGEECTGHLEEALHEATRLASVRLRERGEVSLALEPDLPTVRLGQRHIVQVVLNLLLNAVDAVEMADARCQAHIAVRAWRADGGVRLEVDDNGPGIPLDVLPRLFEPFFTTKPPGKGTGLGLALCREFVSRGGGTLHAENRPGGGARFVLLLPLASRPVDGVDAPPLRQATRG